jgi:fatty acid desaturase
MTTLILGEDDVLSDLTFQSINSLCWYIDDRYLYRILYSSQIGIIGRGQFVAYLRIQRGRDQFKNRPFDIEGIPASVLNYTHMRPVITAIVHH